MKLQVKKLTDTAIAPTRGSAGAAGFDLYADSVEGEFTVTENADGSKTVMCAGGTDVAVHTGIAMAIPKGYVGLLFARSGLSTKQGLRPANCVGVIDEDYRGEVILKLHNDIDWSKFYNQSSQDFDRFLQAKEPVEQFSEFKLHDRVAQIVFVKYDAFEIDEVAELDDTERGTGGFGSTGK